MKIEKKSIDELMIYKNNPVEHTEEQIEKLTEIIKKYGFRQPIIVDKNNIIIAGHGRLEACKKLAYKEIDCIIADDLTEQQIKEYRIADNKIKELSTWNDELLKIELADIEFIDVEIFGFDNYDLDILGLGSIDENIPSNGNGPILIKSGESAEKSRGGNSIQQTDTTEIVSESTSSKSSKLDVSSFMKFDNKCPKCGFEYNN